MEKKKLISSFHVATCWKLSTMFISSQIDSTAKRWHPECINHDLDVDHEKKKVNKAWNLVKTLQNDHILSTRQHSKNWTSRLHQTWFRAYLWKKRFFSISMLQLAENCPQFSFNLKYTAQQKLDIQSASNMI